MPLSFGRPQSPSTSSPSAATAQESSPPRLADLLKDIRAQRAGDSRLLRCLQATDEEQRGGLDTDSWWRVRREVALLYRELEGRDHPRGAVFSVYLGADASRRMHFDEAREFSRQASDQLGVLESELEQGWSKAVFHKGWPLFHTARIQHFQSLGLTDVAEEAVEDFQVYASQWGQGVDGQLRIGVLHQLTVAQVEQRLASGDFREAARLAEGAVLRFPDGSDREGLRNARRRFQLERRAVNARTVMALADSKSRLAVRSELERVAGSPIATGEEVLDARFRAVMLAMADGDRADAVRLADSVDSSGLAVFGQALRAAMVVEAHGDQGTDLEFATLESALGQLYQRWSETPPRTTGTGRFFSDKARYIIRVAAERAIRRPDRGPAAALDLVLRWLSLHDLGRLMNADTVDSERLLSALRGPDDATLVFWTGDRVGLTFVVDSTGVSNVVTAGAELLRRPIVKLNELLSPWSAGNDGWEGEWETSSQKVVNGLLPGGLGTRLAGMDRLTVLGVDPLLGLRIQCVRIDGQPLALSTIVRELPAPGLLLEPSNALVPERSLLVTGVPTASWVDKENRAPEPITLDRRQRARWLNAFGDRVEVLEGEEGSEDSVQSGVLEGAGLCLFFCHGDEADDPERPSGLLLGTSPGGGGDGRLSCSEAEALRSPMLVLLMTCRAGAAPKRIGAGSANDMGGAFVRGGAKAVLLADGDLSAPATAQLVGELAERLARGDTLGEALRGARLALVGSPGFEHPSSLFALGILGDDSLRVRTKGRANTGAMLALVLALVGLVTLVWLGRRRSVSKG